MKINYSSTNSAVNLTGLEEQFQPDVTVEWLALLLRIRKVPVSNLGPETDFPD
jgi:hypothetical protein